ncbi:MAG TPA: tetratricopeptide repeat protein [Nostocaceae cyanobacterium]|nr:tetratricopeptide repeat protein [Nostocaceae cyanobacterium]
MKKQQLRTAIAKNNQLALQRLMRAIALAKGHFSLILVRCNYENLRQEMLTDLRSIGKDIYVREVFLQPHTTALHSTIISELFLDNPAVASDCLPWAVMVFGLETVTNLEDLLININQARDIYSATFPFPLVLWLQDEVASLLSRLAPDFKSWAATTIKFEMEAADLINLIQRETEDLFTKILSTGAEKFCSNATLNLAPKSQHRYELEAARNDLLRLYDIALEPQLEACLEFVLGRDQYVNDQLDEAIEHFQKSFILGQKPATKNVNNYFLKQAVVLFHLGLCYRRLADLHPKQNDKYCQDALLWFKQCIETLDIAKRPNLMAKFILPACEMLYRLQAWQNLKVLANQALKLHKVYGKPAQVAQDYGYLAVVAMAESNWILAHELVSSALAIADSTTGVSRQQESWYLLLLARTKRQLGEWEEAINNLEWARVVCEIQYEPNLYLEIIEELRSLYFSARHDYAEAFTLKQEKIQIEHQYGFRAFIGASQLQPYRYRINPILDKQKIDVIPEEVAQEISTSGRQQDINRLIERITRADYKLTIIHGPSGVGKSSTLKAGLVPALKEKVIGERIPLPIVTSVYSDWLTSVGRNLQQALDYPEILPTLNINTAKLIEGIKLAVERSYIVILIFDQFEEFFFNSSSLEQRSEFYKFFSQCLNLPFVKTILSLREDYLHYLLELERLSKEYSDYNLGVINDNILDKDIRYYLGNFSKQDTINIIQGLIRRSHYEMSSDLIQVLVNDLAGELEEVNPIELQIVGAQLQTENITTLEQYKICGGATKLVERWLEEVIKDCGGENEELSWQLLFELTDEKGTRPLKTKADLVVNLTNFQEENFANLETSRELILDILVGSGLVLRIKEELADRYQLVHDYLVEPIRQKNNYGIVAELEKIKIEKTKAEFAQKLSQEQLNLSLQQRLKEARIAGIALAMMAGTIGALWWQAEAQKRAAIRQTIRAERSETNLKISAIAAASEAFFASNKEFDALLESLHAWHRLKQADGVQPDTRMRVITALQQAVYGVTEINRLEGHTDIVWSVAFSPDGKLLASGSRDEQVKIWKPDGTLLQTLTGHSDAVSTVAWSPDGQTLASASLDKTVQLWRKNPSTGAFYTQPFKTLIGHADWVYSVNFSPDGKLIATASKDGTVKLWGKNGNLVKTLLGHQGWVNWVTFSPNGQFIASASDDRTVKIWRRDGTLVKTLQGYQRGVTVVAFSPNGQILATGGRDRTIKLWRWQQDDSKDGFDVRLFKTLTQHSSTIWSLSFSADSQRLASGSDDNTVTLWSSNGILLKTFRGHSDAVASVAFSPVQKLLASASYDKSIKLWSLDAPSLPVLRGHQDRVLSVAWSSDGTMLASGSRDRTVKLWRRYNIRGKVETRLYRTLTGHTDRVPSVSFDPQGQMLASGSYDRTLKLWRRDGTLINTLRGHSDSVMSVSFSPDGEILASGSKDRTIKLWNRQGHLLKTLVGHQGWVNNVSFSPDGQVLASASDDQTVKLWGRNGQLLKTFSPHESWVLGVSFSPTDQLLASASWDNTVKLWRRDGVLLQTLLKGYSDSVNAVTFSPNGEILAAASWDSTVKLWSRDGKLIKTLNGHRAPVLSVSFSPDGQTLASASDDNTIILWNLNLDDLLVQGCSWIGDYLQHNHNIQQSDRRLCEF